MSGNGDKKANDTRSYDYVQGLTSNSAGEIPIFLQVDSLVSNRRGFCEVFTRVSGPSALVSKEGMGHPLMRKCKAWSSIDHGHCEPSPAKIS